MRSVRAVALGLLLLGALAPAPAAGAQSEPVAVRALTYNIHHGVGRDGELDLFRIAEIVRAADADLIALQEVDRHTQRTGGVDQLAELAALLGMHAEYGRAMAYQGGEYGVAVLSRWPIAHARTLPLPWTVDHEPRAALTVRVRVGESGPWLRFTSTHLDNSRDQEEKLAQARRLLELFGAADEPSVLAGDFNARPGSEVLALLERAWSVALPDGAQPVVMTDGGPAPGSGPRRGPRGDLVLFRPAHHWRVLESRSIDDNVASDHRPVLTVLEWVGPRAP